MSRLGRIRPIDSTTPTSQTPGSTIRIGSKLSGKEAIAVSKQSIKKHLKANNSTVLSIPSSSNTSRTQSKQQIPQAQKLPFRNDKTGTERLLDAIYFICPECSVLQCSTIILGLMVSICLTLLFLYLAGYWDR